MKKRSQLQEATDALTSAATSLGEISWLDSEAYSRETKEKILWEYSRILAKKSPRTARERKRIVEIVEGRVGHDTHRCTWETPSLLSDTVWPREASVPLPRYDTEKSPKIPRVRLYSQSCPRVQYRASSVGLGNENR